MTIHDEGGMRHFYAEWSRRMGREAYDPHGDRQGRDGRLSGARRDLARSEPWKASADAARQNRDRGAGLSLVPRARREGLQGATSTCATTSFRYTITAHSPEIRKDMIWLDHDKPGMQLLFNNLPRHNSDHSPLTRHATVYTVELASDGKRPRSCPRCRCSRPRSTAARRSSSRSGATSTPSASTARRPSSLKRVVRLETRQFGFGYHIPF